MYSNKISAIVPTIGRLHSLQELFNSIVKQTYCVDEVIVADGSASSEIALFVDKFSKNHSEISFAYIPVQPPNAVYQRQKAIEIANGELLLLLDDDMVLEANCISHMVDALNSSPTVVGVCAMLTGGWSKPTRLWAWYLNHVLKLQGEEWQGRVVGPLLRFGYNPPPTQNQEMEWLGTGNSLIKHTTFKMIGGFSDFFLHRCTMNEDVDLGIKLRQEGKILLCYNASMAHNHAPSGRLPSSIVAEDDLYNRFLILKRTLKYPAVKVLRLIFVFVIIETLSGLLAATKNLKWNFFFAQLWGRMKALIRIFRLIVKS